MKLSWFAKEFIVAYRNGTLFIKDKKAVAARVARNRRLARLLFMPAVVFGIVSLRFPESMKVLLLSLGAGYLPPYSVVLLVHLLKNHKQRQEAGDSTERFWGFNAPYFLSRYQETWHDTLGVIAAHSSISPCKLDSSQSTPEEMIDIYARTVSLR